jgi:hypothetical protein
VISSSIRAAIRIPLGFGFICLSLISLNVLYNSMREILPLEQKKPAMLIYLHRRGFAL